jgi:hypothetical protein
MSGTYHMGIRPRKPIESTPNDSPRYTEVRRSMRTHNRGIRLTLEVFAVSRTENVLCEAGLTTLTDMRILSNTKATIRLVTNKEHPITLFCTNPSKIDEMHCDRRH